MPKDPTIAIRDCLAEIAILHEIEGRMTLQAFRSDPIARRAAAYAIQTISEAVRQIPDDWLADFPTEPWGQIKGIGNRIRHEYFRIDDAILWEIITTDTHALKTVMESMLARHAGEGPAHHERLSSRFRRWSGYPSIAAISINSRSGAMGHTRTSRRQSNRRSPVIMLRAKTASTP